MSEIKIARINDQVRWDTFVLSREDAGPYHLYAWKCAIEAAYGHRTFYLMAEGHDSKILGVLPLVLVKPPALRGILVSLPFCDYGGILSSGRAIAEQLMQYAFDLAAALNARLEFRYKLPESALSESSVLGVMSHKVRMVLSLPDGSEVLWNGFKSKLRSQIKRPIKENLEFQLGSLDLLNDFYEVFRINMRDLGSPVHSRTLISSILETFGASAHVGVVYYQDKPVASGIILDHRDMVSIPWASSLDEYSRLSPNMLLYWGFLKYASDNGFRVFDFGRSTLGEGTYKFKEQWGCKPFPLYWYGEGFSDNGKPVLAAGRVRKIMEQTWSKLPQGLVDVLGPAVRQYITL
jgi:FemAB-related protein (PEP-CTERM system-associated)